MYVQCKVYNVHLFNMTDYITDFAHEIVKWKVDK